MGEEYSDRDQRLNEIVDKINYQHRRRITGNQMITPKINYNYFHELEEMDLPIIESFGRYPNGSRKSQGRIDAKKNSNCNSTRTRLMHRKGRLAKFLN